MSDPWTVVSAVPIFNRLNDPAWGDAGPQMTRVRIPITIACHDIRLQYGNWIGASVPGDGDDTAVPVTVKAALELNGTIYPAYFGGVRVATSPAHQFITSEAIPVSAVPGDVVYGRTLMTGTRIPTGSYPRGTAYDGTDMFSIGGNDYVDEPYNPAHWSNLSITYQCGPLAVFGVPDVTATKPSVLFVGDSISAGVYDSYLPTDAAYLAAAGSGLAPGYMARACLAAGIPFSSIGIAGSYAYTFVNPATLKQFTASLFNYRYAICNYGTNDIRSTNRTAGQIEADLLAIWAWLDANGIKAYQATLTPQTTSTDEWTTLANQSPTARESVRLAVNTWLTDGSAMTAAAGTLAGVLDLRSACEDIATGKWKVYSDTPVYSGTATSADSTHLGDTAQSNAATNPDVSRGAEGDSRRAVIEITSGTGSPQTQVVTAYAEHSFTVAGWSGTAPTAGSGYKVYYVSTKDGVHPVFKAYLDMAALIDASLFIKDGPYIAPASAGDAATAIIAKFNNLQKITGKTLACGSAVTVGPYLGNSNAAIAADASGRVTYANDAPPTAAAVAAAVLVTPANKLDTDASGKVTPTDASKTGYALSATGLDSITVTPPSGAIGTWNFRQMMVMVFRRWFGKVTKDSTTIKTYAANGTSVLGTQTISSTGNTQNQGEAS